LRWLKITAGGDSGVENYSGDERRQTVKCEAHELLYDVVKQIRDKLDDMEERQIEQQDRLIRVEAIVQNGLSHNVKEMRERLDKFCDEAEKRLVVLEAFNWFRKPLTKLKDNVIEWLIIAVSAGGVMYFFYHCGNKFLDKVLK